MWSESLTICDPAQEIANRLEAESEGDMGKCKTCVNGYPSVSCVNCGTGFRNYVSNKEENMKVRPLGKDQYRTLWIDLIEKCNAQQQEIDILNMGIAELRESNQALKDYAENADADKDEQAGRIMQMDYLLRRALPILEVTNDQQKLIEAIDALLGGAEG